MYDPDRSQNVIHVGELSTWGAFIEALEEPLKTQNAANGAGIRILTKTFSSPTLADQMQLRCWRRYPQAKWHCLRARQSRQCDAKAPTGVRTAGRDAIQTAEAPMSSFRWTRIFCTQDSPARSSTRGISPSVAILM